MKRSSRNLSGLLLILAFCLAAVWYWSSGLVTQLKSKALLGNVAAQMQLGSMFLKGDKVAQDFPQALKWYRMAAERGDKRGQFFLAIIFDSDHYGEPDRPEEAATWYRRSAEQGYAPAQYFLAALYATGRGVEKSPDMTFYWDRKAAEQGYAPAQGALGYHFEKGEGAPENLGDAFAWYKKSAEGGELESARPVWEMLLSGRGTDRDEATAFAWYRLWKGDAKNPASKFPLNRQLTDLETQKSDAVYADLKSRIKPRGDLEASWLN
jgi:TPR repeat protein